jgi:hypothetical protein
LVSITFNYNLTEETLTTNMFKILRFILITFSTSGAGFFLMRQGFGAFVPKGGSLQFTQDFHRSAMPQARMLLAHTRVRTKQMPKRVRRRVNQLKTTSKKFWK